MGVSNTKSYIDEVNVATFLDEQMKIDDSIADYCFVTPDMNQFLRDMGFS